MYILTGACYCRDDTHTVTPLLVLLVLLLVYSYSELHVCSTNIPTIVRKAHLTLPLGEIGS